MRSHLWASFTKIKNYQMPITPNFSVAQTPGLPSKYIITDISTGSDGAITQRRAYSRKPDGTFLVPSGISTEYVQWSYSDSSITIDALDKDYALGITIQWLNSSNVVLYDKTINTGLTLYNSTNSYQRTQKLSGNPLLINDDDFWERKSILRECIDSGNEAILFASDMFAAQQCYDEGTKYRLNYP